MKFIKCNLVGMDCRYMVKGENEKEVIDQYSQHIKNVHKMNPDGFKNTIHQAVRTR